MNFFGDNLDLVAGSNTSEKSSSFLNSSKDNINSSIDNVINRVKPLSLQQRSSSSSTATSSSCCDNSGIGGRSSSNRGSDNSSCSSNSNSNSTSMSTRGSSSSSSSSMVCSANTPQLVSDRRRLLKFRLIGRELGGGIKRISLFHHNLHNLFVGSSEK
jgi:hypothetical protein